jgi:hypothetical protein
MPYATGQDFGTTAPVTRLFQCYILWTIYLEPALA